MPLITLSFGIIGIWIFHDGVYVPVIVSVMIIAVMAWHLIELYRCSRIGPLTLLLFATFALPFVHLVPYIWFDFATESPLILWGLAANPYMTEKTIVELMAMIGAIGAVGFAAGATLTRGTAPKGSETAPFVSAPPLLRTLSMPAFIGWNVIAVFLTWISAPDRTLFTAAYTESTGLSEALNFASAWMFSYVFFLFALSDAIFETSPRIKAWKWRLLFVSGFLIVVWFQLLRGDRESLTLVLAALLMYYVWTPRAVASVRRGTPSNWRAIALAGFFVLAAAYLVNAARHYLVGVRTISDLVDLWGELRAAGLIRVDNLLSGTWSAALLTPLSVAGDYVNGTLPLKYGQTYLDLLLSVIPGFMADWIGYTRPIDSLRGPAWEMTYGIGGTHAVAVPFLDFRMTGVFLVIALWSFVFAKVERHCVKNLTVPRLALLGVVATAAPHWLWYGEKYIMTALIIWLVLSLLYRIRLKRKVSIRVPGGYQPARPAA